MPIVLWLMIYHIILVVGYLHSRCIYIAHFVVAYDILLLLIVIGICYSAVNIYATLLPITRCPAIAAAPTGIIVIRIAGLLFVIILYWAVTIGFIIFIWLLFLVVCEALFYQFVEPYFRYYNVYHTAWLKHSPAGCDTVLCTFWRPLIFSHPVLLYGRLD